MSKDRIREEQTFDDNLRKDCEGLVEQGLVGPTVIETGLSVVQKHAPTPEAVVLGKHMVETMLSVAPQE